MRSGRRDGMDLGVALLALLLLVGVSVWGATPARAASPPGQAIGAILSLVPVVASAPGPVAPCRGDGCPEGDGMCPAPGCAGVSAGALAAGAALLTPPARRSTGFVTEPTFLPGGLAQHPIVPPPRRAA